MNNRIKTLRKTLNYTQEEFAKKIGLARNSIANYEIGRREPTNAIITSICREFNVSENWLRAGEGPMFIELPEEDEYSKAAASIIKDNDTFAMQMLIEYWKLDSDSKEIFKNFLKNVVTNSKKE